MGGRNTRRWPAPCLGPLIFKRSKTDQFGRGVAVYVGATGDDLCPVSALMEYVSLRGEAPLSLLPLCGWDAPDKGSLHLPCPGRPREGGHPMSTLFGPQLPYRRSDHGRGVRDPGLNDPGVREMVQLGVPLVRQDTPGPLGPALTDTRGCAREIGLLGQHVDTHIPMSHRSPLHLRSLPVAVRCFHGCLSQPRIQHSFYHECTGTRSGYYNFVL